MDTVEGHQGRSPGEALGPSLVQRVKQLYVGYDFQDRVGCGELSLVHRVLASLCSAVDTSLPLPDTHLSHLPGRLSCQSVRCNNLTFGFTP